MIIDSSLWSIEHMTSNSEVKIARLEAEIRELRQRNPIQAEIEARKHRIATFLHQTLCKYTHTYGCSWHHNIIDGKDDWSDPMHQKYSKLAEEIIKRVSINWKIPSDKVESCIKDLLGPCRDV